MNAVRFGHTCAWACLMLSTAPAARKAKIAEPLPLTPS